MAMFGSLVPGMAPMEMPQMRPNAMMQQGMQALAAARQQQGARPNPAAAPPGGPGLLSRLLNPPAPPMDLAAPGQPPNSVPGPTGPMQMGLLSKLFPQLMGGARPGPVAAPQPPVAQDQLGGVY